MAYDNLDPNDTMIVNRGNSSYSVTVDQVSNSSPVLEDNDVFLVNRGDKSFSVTKGFGVRTHTLAYTRSALWRNDY